MLTLPQVLQKHPDKKSLINAVINHIGVTNVAAVQELGPAAGFPGFIYPHDTVKFYRKHRKKLNMWIFAVAQKQNKSPLEMLCETDMFSKFPPQLQDIEINECLSSQSLPENPYTEIEHAFALFTLENVCLLFGKPHYTPQNQ